MNRRARAFTLLEVLLAIGLASGLLGALFAFCNYAMNCRALVVKRIEFVTAERGVMDHLTNELRSAMVYPFLNIGMTSDGNTMSFISSCLPGPGAWAMPKVDEMPPPPEQDMQMMTYRLRVDEETGEATGLERACQKILSSESATAGIETQLVSSQIRFIKFRFFDGEIWRDAWRDSEQQEDGDTPAALLPVAVEIILGGEPVPSGTTVDDYMKTSTFCRRVVFVPSGGAASAGIKTIGASTGGAAAPPAGDGTATDPNQGRRTGGGGGGL
jgi:type II secretory pathway component PulJ